MVVFTPMVLQVFKRLGVLGFVLATWLAWAGCASNDDGASPRICVPNAEQTCTCRAGGRGFRVCAADGSGFGACQGCPDGGAVTTCAGCDGCCGDQGCVPFANESTAACGKGGTTCQRCPAGNSCAQGDCVATTTSCSPTPGASYCCLDTQQIDLFAQDTNKCGTGGDPCKRCENGVRCVKGGCSEGLDENAVFKVRIKRVTALAQNIGASAWDPFNGLPDLYVEFRKGPPELPELDGWNKETASGCSDVLTCQPVGDEAVVYSQIGAKGVFTATGKQLMEGVDILVWDDDFENDDLVGTKTGFSIKQFQSSYKTGPFDQVSELEFELFK